MLHLITGANGTGKTLFTLKWIMERSKAEGRPVAHNGRFKPVPGGPLSTWKEIDFKKWQDEPDGTIFLIDEAHNDLPTRGPGQRPDYIAMLAEHRSRGFDFYLITQHPSNIDSFVRNLIGSPGWHRHLKRVWGFNSSSILEWDAVNLNCQKPGSSSASGTGTTSKFPKEVYSWYTSASLHTGKKKIPKMVFVGIGAIFAVIFGTYFAFQDLSAMTEPQHANVSGVGGSSLPGQTERDKPMTVGEYISHRKPRLRDFPHTAPAYDKVTEPVQAPFPAACVQMKSIGCKCWTQQATVMQTSEEVCLQIVKHGYFVDWDQPQSQQLPASQQSKIQGYASPPAAGLLR